MHVGTFTPEGTWRAARARARALADLGVTIIEMMPVADFAGRFGWGYDGVDLYAPTRLYGTPDDLRAFIDRAHALGIGVILDVVYNHVGPDGNYLAEFSRDYFTDRYKNDWGEAINFETVAAGARVLRRERRLLDRRVPLRRPAPRRDAGHPRRLAGTRHRRADPAGARAKAGSRAIYMVAENEPQDTRSSAIRRRADYGGDALWNDDFHHTALRGADRASARRTTSTTRARRRSSSPAPSTAISIRASGTRWQKQRRGTPALDLPPRAFVSFLENHDQVANTPFGRRLHQLCVAGAAAGADRADAARSGHADALPGPGVRLVVAVPVLRGPQGGAARRRCPKDGGSSCRSFRA